MRINKIQTNTNKNLTFNAMLNIKGKEFLTGEQLEILYHKAEKIGSSKDRIYFNIGKIISKNGVDLTNGVEFYRMFTRKLLAYCKLEGIESVPQNLMGSLLETSDFIMPEKNSELRKPFKYINQYLSSLIDSK